MTKVKLSDNLSSNVWPRIKYYVLGQNPNAGKDETLYMCNYCKSFIKKDKLPSRCVLNGLETVLIPPELLRLDTLSAQ